MKKLFYPIYLIVMKMKNKLAFLPALIASWGILFGIFMIYAEKSGISSYLQDFIPALVINDIDTARTILSTFIAGLISILVFSFSMVMILLNQAASNFSPRLLPGLISNKKHQSILGIYLAGIFYCLIVLISIEAGNKNYQLPGFSVLLGIVVMTISLVAFIYFVHSISQSIQVDNILKSIFSRAEKRLSQLTKAYEKIDSNKQDLNNFNESDNWHPYYSKKSGFIQYYNKEALCELCDEFKTRINIRPNKNTFILSNLAFFLSQNKLSEEQVQKVFDEIIIDDTEPLDNNYVFSFKLITEIGIKAMSPGINDPGTAASCINYITQLLSCRMKKPDESYFTKDEEIKVKLNNISFEKLTYNIFAPFRAYCSHDIIIVKKLLDCLHYLLTIPCEFNGYKQSLLNQAENILSDANQKLSNKQDLKVIEKLADNIKSVAVN